MCVLQRVQFLHVFSILYNQISGKSDNNLNIYPVWGDNSSSDFVCLRQDRNKKNKMIRSKSPAETRQIRALYWSRGAEGGVGRARNFSSGIDISKQNKEEAPSDLFVQSVLLFCIVHQVTTLSL